MAEILGYTATFLFTIMVIPQIVKTIKTKEIKGISIWMYIIFLIANIIALIYAFLISQMPLQIKYTLAIFEALFYISIFIYVRNKNDSNK